MKFLGVLTLFSIILALSFIEESKAGGGADIAGAIIGAGAQLLTGHPDTHAYKLPDGVVIDADNCWEDGGGSCPNGNCLDYNGRRGIVISIRTVNCKWWCGRAKCQTQICCEQIPTKGKRSVSDNSDEPAMNFVAIDTNADLKIDLDEALARVGAKGTLTSPPNWFTDMDTNKDGFIDTEEFDPGLNDQIILDRQGEDVMEVTRDDEMGDLIQRSEVKDVTEVKATASGFWGFRTWNLQAFDANGDLIVQINKNYGSLGNAKKLQDFMAALLKKGYKLTTSQLKELRKKMSIGIGNMLGTASMLGKAGLEVYNGDFMALKKFYDSNPDDKMLISSDLPALRQQHEDYIVDQDIKLY